jgi:hypothetical protein
MPFLRSKSDFAQAMTVTQKLGLHHLMGLQCNYSTHHVQQFFSTLAFQNDEAITMTWMTDHLKCESNFHVFGDVLGYTFQGANDPVGYRVHGPENPRKDVLQDLYEPGYPVGKVAGLLPLYAQLVLLFRDNIAPSGGNNDAIRTSLVNLLHFTSRAAHGRRAGQHFNLDVMDFIFHEIYDAMVSGHSIPYAPYIMMLLKETLGDDYFSDVVCIDHKKKRPYVKKRTPAPSGDTFMADARASGAHASIPRVPSIAKEIKQLNWFQRNILCMNVDIRKSQYQAHLERQQLAHNQDLILHRLRNSIAPPPKMKTPEPYKKWTASPVDWVEIEKQLYLAPSGSSAQQEQGDDEEEDSEAEYESEAEDDNDEDSDGDDDEDDSAE